MTFWFVSDNRDNSLGLGGKKEQLFSLTTCKEKLKYKKRKKSESKSVNICMILLHFPGCTNSVVVRKESFMKTENESFS